MHRLNRHRGVTTGRCIGLSNGCSGDAEKGAPVKMEKERVGALDYASEGQVKKT